MQLEFSNSKDDCHDYHYVEHLPPQKNKINQTKEKTTAAVNKDTENDHYLMFN